MVNDFSTKMWGDIRQAVQRAIETALPLDVTAEAKRIAHANSEDNIALEDIAETLVKLSLPKRVVLFFNENSGDGLALSGEVLRAANSAKLATG